MSRIDYARGVRAALPGVLVSLVPAIAYCGSDGGGGSDENGGSGGGPALLTGAHILTLALAEFNFVSYAAVTNGGLFPGTTMAFDTRGTLVSVNSRVASPRRPDRLP